MILENHNKQNILIVDDNPTNLGLLLEYLADAGFRVLVAESGESALKRTGYFKPDIILLDVMMPGIDGFETCRRLKENKETKEIPIIFMTALANTADKLKGFELGAVDYITKPLQYEEMLARVTTHLTIRELQKELEEKNARLQHEMAEREALVAELQDALVKVKTLKGLLPICASCKKIRNDQGYWQRVEVYIEEHSLVEFTHGLCPDCAKELYPEFYLKDD
jgi:DNA-binding response OmpR family regulator